MAKKGEKGDKGEKGEKETVKRRHSVSQLPSAHDVDAVTALPELPGARPKSKQDKRRKSIDEESSSAAGQGDENASDKSSEDTLDSSGKDAVGKKKGTKTAKKDKEANAPEFKRRTSVGSESAEQFHRRTSGVSEAGGVEKATKAHKLLQLPPGSLKKASKEKAALAEAKSPKRRSKSPRAKSPKSPKSPRPGASSPAEEEDEDLGTSVLDADLSDFGPAFQAVARFASDESASELDLTHCCLGDKGCRLLKDSLIQLPRKKLQSIILTGNYMGAAGVIALMGALERNSALERLTMSWNSIDDRAAACIANTLPRWPALRSLDLSYNRISGDGAKALAAAITQALPLQHVDLRGNWLSTEAQASLDRAVLQKGQRQAPVSPSSGKRRRSSVRPHTPTSPGLPPSRLVSGTEDSTLSPPLSPTSPTSPFDSVRRSRRAPRGSPAAAQTPKMSLLSDSLGQIEGARLLSDVAQMKMNPTWFGDPGHSVKHGLAVARGELMKSSSGDTSPTECPEDGDDVGFRAASPASSQSSTMKQRQEPEKSASMSALSDYLKTRRGSAPAVLAEPRGSPAFSRQVSATSVRSGGQMHLFAEAPRPLVLGLDKLPMTLPAGAWKAQTQLARALAKIDMGQATAKCW
eukprot:TRINITY_DN17080_c0_g1_i1.p1 TRINITY_DN17080_c0_g1~~TRINITY_DN17080_c0_g1_i1.p1  ORF type:complete len:635 (+),score=133.74 TRINITY_DN17080_c0_g1_i1:95-1999(+)